MALSMTLIVDSVSSSWGPAACSVDLHVDAFTFLLSLSQKGDGGSFLSSKTP